MYVYKMYCVDAKVRVRYAETDQMGFVYYGVYAQYYDCLLYTSDAADE